MKSKSVQFYTDSFIGHVSEFYNNIYYKVSYLKFKNKTKKKIKLITLRTTRVKNPVPLRERKPAGL